jgi:hypothetical protein
VSYKIINPTTNPDRIGIGGMIIPGTPDQSVEFPTGGGTVALTSQIPPTPPPTIYQTDPTIPYDWVNNTTTYRTVSGSIVTGLEPNYLYRLTYIAEFGASGFATYIHNFGFRILTAGGNLSPSGNSSDLWLSAMGGVVNYEDSTDQNILYPANYQLLQEYGWRRFESTSVGDQGRMRVEVLYKTGTTADQCSVRLDAALGTAEANASLEVFPYELAVILEPIKSLA